MDDDIQLPPLPSIVMAGMPTINAWIDELRRAAVLADRERRAEKAKRADPAVYSMTLSVGHNGSWSCYPPSIYNECATVTICWTDDGRAWIESERNRELAAKMRNALSVFAFAEVGEVADALDGGVR